MSYLNEWAEENNERIGILLIGLLLMYELLWEEREIGGTYDQSK